MWWKAIIGPIAARVGTALGSALVTLGVATDDVNIIVAGAVAAITVAVDLFVANKWGR